MSEENIAFRVPNATLDHLCKFLQVSNLGVYRKTNGSNFESIKGKPS